MIAIEGIEAEEPSWARGLNAVTARKAAQWACRFGMQFADWGDDLVVAREDVVVPVLADCLEEECLAAGDRNFVRVLDHYGSPDAAPMPVELVRRLLDLMPIIGESLGFGPGDKSFHGSVFSVLWRAELSEADKKKLADWAR